MTKLKGILLIVACSFLWTSCNTTTSKEVAETLSADKVVQIKNDYKSGKWLEALPSKTPLTFNQLEDLLPESLLGRPLLKVIDDTKNGKSAIRGQYSSDKEPNKESEVITFLIVDGAGEEGYKHLKSVFSMLKFPTNEDDGKKILKITDWENKRLLVRQRQLKEQWQSEMEFIKNLRFHFKIHGKNLKLEDISESAITLERLNFPD